ncbi:lycopene cyclase, partial [Saccharothrix sp. MB29]|nr:lycopene cyclase [Saccharothrix sp. MB29]
MTIADRPELLAPLYAVLRRPVAPVRPGVAVKCADIEEHRGEGGRGAAQTAVGVVVPAGAARPFVDADEAVIMDWRKPPVATTADPTFLYAIPVSATHVLLEETSLARRPGLPLAELRLRLHGRLAAHGVAVPEDEERVRIPLDGRPRDWAFGAASGLIHPATGY